MWLCNWGNFVMQPTAITLAVRNGVAASCQPLFRHQTFLFMHLILIRMRCTRVINIGVCSAPSRQVSTHDHSQWYLKAGKVPECTHPAEELLLPVELCWRGSHQAVGDVGTVKVHLWRISMDSILPQHLKPVSSVLGMALKLNKCISSVGLWFHFSNVRKRFPCAFLQL